MEKSKENNKMNSKRKLTPIFYIIVLFFCTAFVIAGSFAVLKLEDVKRERVEIAKDLKTRNVIKLAEGIPKCVANCIFPKVLDIGCGYSDYDCICSNFGNFDDVTRILEGRETPYVEESFATFVGGFEGCYTSCGFWDQINAIPYIHNLCQTIKSPVTFPKFMGPLVARVDSTSQPPAFEATQPPASEATKSETSENTSEATDTQPTDTQAATPMGLATQSVPPTLPQNTAPALPTLPTLTTPTTLVKSTGVTQTSPVLPKNTGSTTNTGSTANTGSTGPAVTDIGATTASGSLSSASTSYTTTDSGQGPANTSWDASNGGGLSMGAKIGVGVVVPLIFILIGGGVAFWWFRLRKKKTNAVPEISDNESRPEPYTGMPELNGGTVKKREDRVEIGGREIKKGGLLGLFKAKKDAVEADSTPINNIPQMDDGRTEKVGVYEMGNNEAAKRNMNVVRKPIADRTASGFPAPWAPGERDGMATPEYPRSSSPVPSQSQAEGSVLPYQVPLPQSPDPTTEPVKRLTAEDAELARLEREVEQIRQQKERLRHIEQLEARERELLRGIEERKNGGESTS